MAETENPQELALEQQGQVPPTLGGAAATGIAWTFLLNICGRLASLVSQLFLAKLLVPEDFGVLGLATTVTTIFGILTSFGIDQVLQQRRTKMHLWATQALVLSFVLASIVALAMAVYAPLGARLYHNDKITGLIWIIAASMPLAALSTVPQAKLKAMMEFKFLSLYGSAEVLVLQVLIVLCAWQGLGALSFVLPLPFLATIRACVYWRTASMPLRSFRRSKGWRPMIFKGSGVFGVTVLTTCISQGDYITLGLVASAHVVGVYFFAFKLVAMPMILLGSNFTGVLRPALVAMKGDAERQSEAAFRTAEMLGLITVPICFLQAAVAGPGLTFLFGERWKDAIPLIQILSIGLPLDSIAWAAGSLLEARGKFGKSFRYQLISAPFFFIFVGVGALLDSATGVAIGVTIYYILHPLYLTCVIFLKESIGLKRILACFYLPFILGIITIGGAYLLSQLSLFNGHLITQIALILLLGSAGYGIAFKLCVPRSYAVLKDRLFKIIKRDRVKKWKLAFVRKKRL